MRKSIAIEKHRNVGHKKHAQPTNLWWENPSPY